MKNKIEIILLAAGNSRRFGSNKLLTEFRGKPLYKYTLDIATIVAQSLKKINIYSNIVIVSQYDEIINTAFESECLTIKNNKPELGISYSIKLALKNCIKRYDNEKENYKKGEDVSYIFFVCDQPLLRSESVIKLIIAFLNSDKNIGCLAYKNRMGNPCIFDSKYVQDLFKLEGDSGGKKIILLNSDSTLIVNCNDEKELFDIDDIGDFQRLDNDLE